MKEKHGQFILLYWDGEPGGHYIKGHVSLEEAQAEMERQEEFKPSSIQHKYGRWAFPDWCTPEGCDFQLKVYDHPQRGAFKLTECFH